ncbi:MAG: hypothetical protein J5962_02515, partial [Lachnospiraceae bacterium]|nr:hypothetical protein [Lachnospiraceae bacterium]
MKLKGKKKRLLALMMCLLMVATLFQGNGYSALADVTGGVSAPSGEMATAGDAEEMPNVEDEGIAPQGVDNEAFVTEEEDINLQGENQTLNIKDVSAKLNGVELTDGMEVRNNDVLAVTIEWKIPNAADDRNPEYVYEYQIDTKGITLPDIT